MRYKYLIPLLVMVVLDSILTWVLWNKGIMEEGNPLMLWGLTKGALGYWSIKIIQILVVYFLIMNVNLKLKVFQYGYAILIAIYSLVMVMFAVILIGLL